MDLLGSTLGGMDCILGMEFIIQNNVFIEGHNRLVRIPSKSGIMRVKAHELPCVGGPTIHFMLGKTWKKECVGGHNMICVMRVLDEFEPEEATELVNRDSLQVHKASFGRVPGCDARRIARILAPEKTG